MTKTTSNVDSPVDLLQAAYQQLEFDQGRLLAATRQPQSAALGEWLERGDWQSLAAQVGAETVFFVDRDPVIVFAKSDDNSPEILRKLYERIWCMSRPQLLFLATLGQLVVYDLTKAPLNPHPSMPSIKWTNSVENDLGVGIQLSINQKGLFLSCRSASVLRCQTLN